jgi:histidyl-tRNA synthetase
VLVALNGEESRSQAYAVASARRARGVSTEVFHAPQKFGKQIRYAERKGIPYVLFATEGGTEIRDIRSGEQTPVELSSWMPPAQDLHVSIVREG